MGARARFAGSPIWGQARGARVGVGGAGEEEEREEGVNAGAGEGGEEDEEAGDEEEGVDEVVELLPPEVRIGVAEDVGRSLERGGGRAGVRDRRGDAMPLILGSELVGVRRRRRRGVILLDHAEPIPSTCSHPPFSSLRSSARIGRGVQSDRSRDRRGASLRRVPRELPCARAGLGERPLAQALLLILGRVRGRVGGGVAGGDVGVDVVEEGSGRFGRSPLVWSCDDAHAAV